VRRVHDDRARLGERAAKLVNAAGQALGDLARLAKRWSTASTTSSMEQAQIESCAESRSRRATPVQRVAWATRGIGEERLERLGTALECALGTRRRLLHVHRLESTPSRCWTGPRAQLAHMAFEPFGRGGGEILGERGDLEA